VLVLYPWDVKGFSFLENIPPEYIKKITCAILSGENHFGKRFWVFVFTCILIFAYSLYLSLFMVHWIFICFVIFNNLLIYSLQICVFSIIILQQFLLCFHFDLRGFISNFYLSILYLDKIFYFDCFSILLDQQSFVLCVIHLPFYTILNLLIGFLFHNCLFFKQFVTLPCWRYCLCNFISLIFFSNSSSSTFFFCFFFSIFCLSSNKHFSRISFSTFFSWIF